MNFGTTLINRTTLLNPSAKGADESSKSPRTRSTTWPSQRSLDLRPDGPAAIVTRGKLGREKNPDDRRQSERTGGSLVWARCSRGSALSRGRLFVRIRRGRLSGESRRIAARQEHGGDSAGRERREHGPVIAKASLIESISAEEALRRFRGLRPARSARRSRPSPRPLHRARPKGRRSRPPGLPPSGSGSLSTCP